MKSAVQPFPWEEAMGFAFSVLRLTPDAFWAMTPRELSAAMRFANGGKGGARPERAALEVLMQRFPDQKKWPEPPDRSGD